ncbi:SurA N-terminal domain-containing protein [Streptomyces sp. NPDC059506]|uniref:SurA N-terminal domain-containing protein n=1 Tax=unclassified Streptomyces TaxID=2593676 RepID=UPI000CBA5685|nr:MULTISPECIES: SurA N-terminal domain-containing protein [unclassified Streptomyces]MCZ2528019.1 SurA N-terminal domain-containing protein [Streptomyces sp. HB2AG]PLW74514.1 hypothetical protein C0036_01490 [Streptomyces sp. DJ]QMV23117.1 hypothetical protein GQS52_16550 [Streptomyces sp. SCUT-3]
MIRRSVSLLAAAAVLGAAPLLSACGTPHAGAAAVVGGEAVSVSALQAKVKEVRDAQADSVTAAGVPEPSSDLSRATLNGIVFDKVLYRAAADAGVKATRAEVQEDCAERARQAGGTEALRTMLLQRYGIAPGEVEEFCRNQATAQKLARKLGADLQTPEGQAVVLKELSTTSRSLDIDISPRYGTWDDKELSLNGVKEEWLRPAEPQGA